jgi:hypothetical protein
MLKTTRTNVAAVSQRAERHVKLAMLQMPTLGVAKIATHQAPSPPASQPIARPQAQQPIAHAALLKTRRSQRRLTGVTGSDAGTATDGSEAGDFHFVPAVRIARALAEVSKKKKSARTFYESEPARYVAEVTGWQQAV